MELREALAQIADIRIRMAETELFHGYRSLPIAMSGLLAIVAALMQPYIVGEPTRDVLDYCAVWVTVAVLSVMAVGLTMVLRDYYGGASRTRDVTLYALTQLAPSLVAGGLITVVIVRDVPEAVGLLPGLWQLLFSLGLFASCRLLPRSVGIVAFFYLVSGTVAMAMGRGEWALHPLLMGLPFGVGQLLLAGILYWNLERSHEEH
jgi:hypothetical protein